MWPPSYMRSVVDRNVVMRRMTVFKERTRYVCVLTVNEPETARRQLMNVRTEIPAL